MTTASPTPLRAVTYERYSTDMQNEASIETQRRENLAFIARMGWVHVDSFSDQQMSGQLSGRPGMLALKAAAYQGAFDVVVAFGVDRLSRKTRHIVTDFEELESLDIAIFAKGRQLDAFMAAVEGALAERQVRETGLHTRRGLGGKVSAGLSAGSIAYGYRVDDDPLKAGGMGHRVVDPGEAAIVRRIFEEYARGDAPRAIAHRLNDEHVPPPRGGRKRTSHRPGWSGSTINGNRKRGTGILNNELYAGRLVWGRLTYARDFKSEKRRSRPSREEAQVTPVPELRIVSNELWDKVKARQAALDAKRDGARTAPVRNRRPVRALSGLLKCPECGGGISVTSHGRVGCSTHKNKGDAACTNAATVPYDVVLTSVLASVKDDLMRIEAVEHFLERYNGLVDAAVAAAEERRANLAAAAQRLDEQIARLVDAIADGRHSPAIASRLKGLEAERAEIDRKLAEPVEVKPLTLPTDAPKRYRGTVERLIAMAEDPGRVVELNDLLHRLLERVVVHPPENGDGDASGDGWEVELFGALPALMDAMAKDDASDAEVRAQIEADPELLAAVLAGLEAEAPVGAGGAGRQVLDSAGTPKMVAGVGFEPTTFRL